MKISYSAEGEDVLIQTILERCFHMDDHSHGFYVDVGAYHPWHNSNTAALFQTGWSGVNIDARPGSMQAFLEERPGDANVEIGVSDHEGHLRYITMSRPELSGFLTVEQVALQESRGAEQVTYSEIPVTTLARLLLPPQFPLPAVDFLTVDVEGHELEVLRGFPWERTWLRPKVIAVEVLSTSMRSFLDHPVVTFLEGYGYHLASRLHCTAIFVDDRRAVWR